VTRDDQLELAGLVGLAWERRGQPDFREAIAAIVDWHDRRDVRALERRRRSTAALLQVLRETAPPPREWVGNEPPAYGREERAA
jgi:hypothetical protein